MGLLRARGVLDDLRQPEHLTRQAAARPGHRRAHRASEDRPGETRFGRLAQDRADPGVRVLHVVHRVLADCFWPARCRSRCGVLGAREANDQRAASTPTSSSSSSSVMNSPERLLIGTSCAVAHEAHPGDQQHLDCSLVEAHGLGGVADARDRAVMVGAPDVDELVEAAAELLGDVADVRGEVGRLARWSGR